jgi:integrase
VRETIPLSALAFGCSHELVPRGIRSRRPHSSRIDLYLEQFRSCIPGADKHAGLWASNKGRPMVSNGIYLTVWKRTKKALGFGVNLHRFRHAAASFWSSQDPGNVKGVKDLLGHASFATTQKHYIMAQSRLAGRVFARAIDAVRK